ncbi:hypothetical protein, variant 2 [Aphanomyces invadans]|uniref:Uncharacterized protein n=1 Tax=Aphanomyces invadans TaxID=157072 RepID=A0A024TSF3_9STRA|nr:hypothetical protein, variant 2 [Aphanomyces invadans]ETV97090.1 hypothetical protein, variant 2 [Aphanomyces invadans]|eukprot:XP_008874336.1 hypothetical protein, variant 2 [Aphanomyces invadans]
MPPSNNSIGQALVYLRPLRHMFDVVTTVSVLNDDGNSLGSLVVHVRPSPKATPSDAPKSSGNNAKLVPADVDDLSDDEMDDMKSLDGEFLWISIQVHVDPSTPSLLLANPANYRVSYVFFQSNTQVFPLEHANMIKVLVTPPFVDYVSADTMSFEVVPFTDVASEPRTAELLSTTAPPYDDALLHTALLEEIQRDKAKMAQEHEAEKKRNEEMRGEMSKLIHHVKEQEDTILEQVKMGQTAASELVV